METTLPTKPLIGIVAPLIEREVISPNPSGSEMVKLPVRNSESVSEIVPFSSPASLTIPSGAEIDGGLFSKS